MSKIYIFIFTKLLKCNFMNIRAFIRLDREKSSVLTGGFYND